MLRRRGLGTVLRGLAELGFDAAWDVISAADVGANHSRKRMWVLAAHPDRQRREDEAVDALREDRRDSGDAAVARALGDADLARSHAGAQLEGRSTRDGARLPEPERRGDDVADAGCERGEPDRAAREVARAPREAEGEEDQRERRGDAAGDRGAPVADSGGEGLPLPEREELCGEGWWNEGGAAAERSWWCIEPDVGGGPDGISEKLDSGTFFEALRELRHPVAAKTLERTTRRLGLFQAEKVLLSVVCEYTKGGRIRRELMEGEATHRNLLREMRINRQVGGTSLRREQIQQLCCEHPDAMPELSRLVASHSPSPWANPLWEGSTSRIARGVRDRVERLKALGNAQVPLQAAFAFQRLLAALTS